MRVDVLRLDRALEEFSEEIQGGRARETRNLVGGERARVEGGETAVGVPDDEWVKSALLGDALLGEHVGGIAVLRGEARDPKLPLTVGIHILPLVDVMECADRKFKGPFWVR